jgi:ArsR family metal-binding transcriptional regulator
MNLSEDEIKRQILSFETGKMDEILSDLAALIIQFKDLRDKKIIEEKILERVVTIYEHLQTAVVNSRLEDERLGKQ